MPKDNEVDEKVIEAVARALCKSRSLGPEVLHIDATGEMPVDGTVIAMIDGKLAERPAFFGWRKQVVHAIAALEAADHAATVAELRASADAAERRVGELTSLLSDTVGNLHRMGNNEFADCDQERLDIVISRIERTLTGADPT